MAEHLGTVLWFMGTLFSTMWLDGLKKKFFLAHMSSNSGRIRINRMRNFSRFNSHRDFLEVFLKFSEQTLKQFKGMVFGNLRTLDEGSTGTV